MGLILSKFFITITKEKEGALYTNKTVFSFPITQHSFPMNPLVLARVSIFAHPVLLPQSVFHLCIAWVTILLSFSLLLHYSALGLYSAGKSTGKPNLSVWDSESSWTLKRILKRNRNRIRKMWNREPLEYTCLKYGQPQS